MVKSTTVPDIAARKGSGQPIVMLTAYDAPTARIAAQAEVDVILVGDTLGMVVLGYEDTLHVTIEDMEHHIAAVRRTRPSPLVVGDLPWLTYHTGNTDAVRNAARLVRAGAQAVKLEGGEIRCEAIRAIVDTEIPVMGHIGLTPQSMHVMGGFKVQGRDQRVADRLLRDASALVSSGCFSIVLEGIPADLAAKVTAEVPVPTIGIGAGPACDGQVLVFHDLLGLERREPLPRFVRQYADLAGTATDAVRRWADDVRRGSFPNDSESYHSRP